MKVLVTGATGFIGSRLVKALAARGDEVRALVFPGEDCSGIAGEAKDIREGDITSPATLRGVADGIDVVYHLAARVKDYGSREDFYRPIVEGTRNLLAACAGSAGRFVFVSSICACGTGRHMKGLNEADPCVTTGVFYGDAKLEAEELVKESGPRFPKGWVIVRPANVIGPGSVWVAELGSVIRDGLFTYFDAGRYSASLIFVDNLVDGLLLCGTKPQAAGRIFFFRDNWDVTWKKYLDDLAALVGGRIRFSLPFALAWFLGGVFEKATPWFERRPPITRHAVGLMGRDNDVDTARAKTELGWRTRVSYEQALEEIKVWVRRNMWTKGLDGTVVITGGSSGLGLALAERLLRRGASMALLARDQGKLRTVKERLEQGGRNVGRVEIFPCDVSRPEEVEKTFLQIAERLGPPDILINSAGILREGYFETQSLSTVREVMDINFFGTLHCVRAVLPFFRKKGGGRIVNVSSLAGLMGTFGYTAYCSSKHAVAGLTHTLRTELKPEKISFHLVCPTEFESPMVEEMNKSRTPENKAMVHTIPVSTLHEVADAVIRGMEKDQYLIIPGWITRLVERTNRWFPALNRAVVDFRIGRTYHGPERTH